MALKQKQFLDRNQVNKWTSRVCGLAADSNSVHQADNRLPAMRLRSLWNPYPPLHVLSLSLQPANRQSQRCMQLLSVALTLDGDWAGLDWTGLGAGTPVCPPRARGVYSMAYMLQGR